MSLRRALVRLRHGADDLYNQIRADFAPMPALDLFSFAGADDVARFQVTTDRVLGGASDCTFSLKAYRHFSVGSFAGTIDWPSGTPASARGGFASFRTRADERVRDVSAFGAFQLRVKTDGRAYVANFKCAGRSPEHLWQVRLHAPAFTWVTLAVPFRDLVLTKRGRVDEHQFEFEREALNGFGVLLADGANGPFRFEVQSVAAIRSIDPSQWEPAPELALGGAAAAAALDAPAPALPPPADGPPPGASREELLKWHAAQREAFAKKTAGGLIP
jgi:hypothetical protein